MLVAAAEISEADRVGRVCVHEILARCASRQSRSDSDWKYEVDGMSYRAFSEGLLAKQKVDGAADEWIFYWRTTQRLRPIDRGSLADIECSTREAILFGPPGGLGDGSGPRVWVADEGSLFADTIRGSFRLMPRPDGRGTLICAREDFVTLFLGDGSIEELKRNADKLLREHHGDPIRGWIGRRRLDFHGLGVAGGVAQLELMRGTRLMLVRAGEDRYDLYIVEDGRTPDLIRSYTAAALTHGDLGQLFGPVDVRVEEASDCASVGDRTARPRRSPPHQGRGQAPHAERVAPPPRRTILSDDERSRLENCFSPTGPFGGEGSSEMAAVYAGLRELLTRGLPDMRIKTEGFIALLVKEGKVQFKGCTKTFIRAAERVLAAMKFGARVGHWWILPFAELRRPDSAALTLICENFEPVAKPSAGSPPASSTESSTPAPPAESPSEALPTSSTPAPTGSPTATPPASTPAAAYQTSATSTMTSAPLLPATMSVSSTSVPSASPLETGPPPLAADLDVDEDDVHYHPVIRQDGQPLYYQPLYPHGPSDPEPPSRYSGKPRGSGGTGGPRGPP